MFRQQCCYHNQYNTAKKGERSLYKDTAGSENSGCMKKSYKYNTQLRKCESGSGGDRGVGSQTEEIVIGRCHGAPVPVDAKSTFYCLAVIM